MDKYIGNVISFKKYDKVIIVRFAIDDFLLEEDTDRPYQFTKKTYFLHLKFFGEAMEKFELSKVNDGAKLKITDYKSKYFTKNYVRENPIITRTELFVNDFEVLALKAFDSLEEAPKSEIVFNKPIAQYANDKESSEGDPSWMTE